MFDHNLGIWEAVAWWPHHPLMYANWQWGELFVWFFPPQSQRFSAFQPYRLFIPYFPVKYSFYSIIFLFQPHRLRHRVWPWWVPGELSRERQIPLESPRRPGPRPSWPRGEPLWPSIRRIAGVTCRGVWIKFPLSSHGQSFCSLDFKFIS